jgi:glycerol-3-phosphate dehydrogenase subunit C
MREGSLEAPVRHALAWKDPDFYDRAKVEAECERVFDICHGCRRCFNLCDSFPRLFELVDNSPTGELDGVAKADYKQVVDACTLCDMCFMTKCPYVPPHEFNLDFPHLMLRYRAVERKEGKLAFAERQLIETDRNGRIGALTAPLANWATDRGNKLTRPLMEKVAGVDQDAALPKFHGKTFTMRAKNDGVVANRAAPAFGKRKAVLYATCFCNYNNPQIGEATRAVLAHNGVETEVVYPGCCGMPQLEHANLERVAKDGARIAAELCRWVDKGYDIVALIPSCALMLKFEWPLVMPDDPIVKRLAQATFDVAEYVVDIAKKDGLAPGLKPVEGGVTVHLACHARAQNMGQKATEMLRLIPETRVAAVERCSGHGGSWGIFKGNFETALKVGKPVARQAVKNGTKQVASECPLAGMHIIQGIEKLGEGEVPSYAPHPIEIMAKAWGLR